MSAGNFRLNIKRTKKDFNNSLRWSKDKSLENYRQKKEKPSNNDKGQVAVETGFIRDLRHEKKNTENSDRTDGWESYSFSSEAVQMKETSQEEINNDDEYEYPDFSIEQPRNRARDVSTLKSTVPGLSETSFTELLYFDASEEEFEFNPGFSSTPDKKATSHKERTFYAPLSEVESGFNPVASSTSGKKATTCKNKKLSQAEFEFNLSSSSILQKEANSGKDRKSSRAEFNFSNPPSSILQKKSNTGKDRKSSLAEFEFSIPTPFYVDCGKEDEATLLEAHYAEEESTAVSKSLVLKENQTHFPLSGSEKKEIRAKTASGLYKKFKNVIESDSEDEPEEYLKSKDTTPSQKEVKNKKSSKKERIPEKRLNAERKKAKAKTRDHEESNLSKEVKLMSYRRRIRDVPICNIITLKSRFPLQ